MHNESGGRILLKLLWALFTNMALQTIAFADNAVIPESSIRGLQLWQTWSSNSVLFLSAENEFVSHCRNGGAIYVENIESPVGCRSSLQGQSFVNSPDYKIELDTKRLSPGDVVIASIGPVPKRIRPQKLTQDEREKLLKEARELAPRYLRESRDRFIKQWKDLAVTAEQFDSLRLLATEDDIYKKNIGRLYKLSTPPSALFIAPIGILPEIQGGWDIVNAIYSADRGALLFLGYLAGCIRDFRDLNADGYPDILVSTCVPGEGGYHSYISVHPEFTNLMHVAY